MEKSKMLESFTREQYADGDQNDDSDLIFERLRGGAIIHISAIWVRI
jgi:hypothetical protein